MIMSKNELIDAYFEGGMTEGESQDFLNQVSNDADLKQEFNFQSDIIEGLKQARISELKTMLNNVPVSGGFGSINILSKIASVGGVILVAGLSYYYFSDNSSEQIQIKPKHTVESIDDLIVSNETLSTDTDNTISSSQEIEEKADIQLKETAISKNNTVKGSEKSLAPQINKPTLIEPLELTEESDEEFETPSSGIADKSSSPLSAIDVELDNSKKKYSFHYQLKDGKLFLFGSFDKGLYEILEFNSSNGKTLFLYYKDKYYGLSKTQDAISPLNEVTEPTLITKLEVVRKEIKE
jgi:hypothetical protein